MIGLMCTDGSIQANRIEIVQHPAQLPFLRSLCMEFGVEAETSILLCHNKERSLKAQLTIMDPYLAYSMRVAGISSSSEFEWNVVPGSLIDDLL